MNVKEGWNFSPGQPKKCPSLGARGRRIVQSVMTVTLKLGNHDYVIAKVYEFGGTVT